MRSDVLRLAGALLVVGALVLLVTRVDAGSGEASVRVVSASGAARVSHSVAGDVVVSAADMRPGGRTSGTVTVANGGDATGAFEVTQNDVLDTPGAGEGRLSTAARLRIDDSATGRPVYQGVLGAMAAHPVGYLRAGEQRAYRLTVSLPNAAPADAFAGARVETRFDWTARTAEPPKPESVPPTVVAQTPAGAARGGPVTLALTCDRPCSVIGVSRGARIVGRRPRLAPGRPALLAVAVGEAAVQPLSVTVAGPAGARATRALP